jgi:hypothetical protein
MPTWTGAVLMPAHSSAPHSRGQAAATYSGGALVTALICAGVKNSFAILLASFLSFQFSVLGSQFSVLRATCKTLKIASNASF